MKRLFLIIAIVIVLVSLNWFKEVFAGELGKSSPERRVASEAQYRAGATTNVNAHFSGTP